MPVLIHKQDALGVTPDIDSLGNVNITNPQDNEGLKYDATNNEWKNAPIDNTVVDPVKLYGDIDISSWTNLKSYTIGNYYYVGNVSTHFSDAPTGIPNVSMNLNLTIRRYRKSYPFVFQELTLGYIENAEKYIKTFIRYGSANVVEDWTDWIDITNTESVSSLSELTDVNITNPQDGDGIKFDAEANEWVNGPVGGIDGVFWDLEGGTELTGTLHDVDLNTITEPGTYYGKRNEYIKVIPRSILYISSQPFLLLVQKIDSDYAYPTIIQHIYMSATSIANFHSFVRIRYASDDIVSFTSWAEELNTEHSIDRLSNVTLSSLTAGQGLFYDSTFKNMYLSDSRVKYDANNSLADIIGDIESLLAAL